MLHRLLRGTALAGALLLTACVPKDGAGPGTSAAGWHQIAVGVGTVVGQTNADAQIAKASAQLERYCGALQAVAFGVSIFGPEKHRAIAAQASAAVATLCAEPPRDVASSLTAAVRTYEAIQAAGRAAGVPVQPVPATGV